MYDRNEYIRNKDKHAEWSRKYRQSPKGKLNNILTGKRFKQRHPERVLEINRKSLKKYRKQREIRRYNKYLEIGKSLKLTPSQITHGLQGWRLLVKKRDSNLCQVSIQPEDQRLINSITGINSPISEQIKAVHAHHILFKGNYPLLCLNINNGISLSKKSHAEVHGWK